MNRNLCLGKLALAIAVSCAAHSTLADDSTVTIYGKLNLSVEQVKATGCNANPVTNAAGTTTAGTCTGTGDIKSRNRVSDTFSYIGFKGTEPLGGGLDAFYQVETLIKADSSGGNQTVSTGTSNTWASRNSGVGLRGKFGEILFGRWDVYYVEHIPGGDPTFLRGPFAATALAILGGQSGIGGISFDNLSGANLAANVQTLNIAQGAGPVDFGGRRSDMVRYQSPNWSGFQFRVNYLAPELKRSYSNGFGDFEASNAGYSGTLSYLDKHFYANYSYYKRNDVGFAIAVADNDSTAHKLTLGTSVGKFKIGVIAEKLKHESRLDALGLAPATTVDGGTTNTIHRERNAYVLFVGYDIGSYAIGTTYGRAQKVKDKDGSCGALCENTAANYYQITGIKNLSKRTNLYLTFAKIRNQSNASYDFFNQGGVSDTSLIARGSDPQSISMGINHFF